MEEGQTEKPEQPKGPLELAEVQYRRDAEDELEMECPFCMKRLKFTKAQEGQIWYHKACAASDGPVAFLNGYALRGIAEYKRKNIPKGRS